MDAVALICRIFVGIALVVAGMLKLRDAPSWSRQAADMGVRGPVALVVPWVELGLGAALIVQFVRPWPAVAAVALLVAFTAVLANRLRDRSRPPCGCFGSRHATPLSKWHVLRTVGLVALAVVGLF